MYIINNKNLTIYIRVICIKYNEINGRFLISNSLKYS